MKILVLPSDTFGCGHYRTINPTKAYQIPKDDILPEHNMVLMMPGTYTLEQLKKTLPNYDAVLYQHPTDLKINDVVFDSGIKVIVDTDDMCDNIDNTNPAYQFFKPGSECGKAYIQALRGCKGIINATEYLASYNTKYNPVSITVPNYIDISAGWEEQFNPAPDTLRFGWFGSSSHAPDLPVVMDAMDRILRKYSNVRLVLMGDTPLVARVTENLPHDKLIIVPPQSFQSYHKLLNYDIGLCPAVPNAFNNAKSDLKILEHSAKLIPSICSAITPYLKHPARVIVPEHTSNSWYKTIDSCIQNLSEIVEINGKAHRYLVEERILQKNTGTWISAIEDIIAGTIEPVARATENRGRNSICECGSGLKYKKCCGSNV